jgi:hypothetical protein
MSDTYIGPDGIEYGLGLEPRVYECGAIPLPEGRFLPVWDGTLEDCPVLPRSEWGGQASKREYEWDDVNQGRTPSCTFASSANGFQFFQAMNGRQKVRMDFLAIWREHTGGRGGANIGQALQRMMSKGFPTVDGDRIKIVEAWDLPDVASLFSASRRGCPVIFGWNFPGGAHAECMLSVVMDGNNAYADVRNTHGKSYGEQGWHRVSERDIAAGIRKFGAYAIREIELQPGDLKGMEDAKA